MKKWKITLEIQVSENWIQDGFDASERIEQIEENLEGILLPYAIAGQEIKVKATVISKPDPKVLSEIMGY